MTTPDRITAEFLADVEQLARESHNDVTLLLCAELRLAWAERDEARKLLDDLRANEIEGDYLIETERI